MSESITWRRWIAKKAARAVMAYGSWATGVLAARDLARIAPCVRVVTYHRFGDGVREPFRVPARDFELQMRHLAERGLALSLSDFEAFLRGDLVPPEGAVLVTIDDGSLSAHRIALPILRDLAVPAVLYTVAGAVGSERGPDGNASEPHASWDELTEMIDGGIDVQSHSMTHRSMAQIDRSEARDEAARSKALLEERLGREVSSFAYPYGTRADYDDETAAILASAGYRTIFTSQHGPVLPGVDPTALPRVKIEGGEGMGIFTRTLAGGLDGWAMIDQTMARVQARR